MSQDAQWLVGFSSVVDYQSEACLCLRSDILQHHVISPANQRALPLPSVSPMTGQVTSLILVVGQLSLTTIPPSCELWV